MTTQNPAYGSILGYNTTRYATSTSVMLAYPAQVGDVVIRTDLPISSSTIYTSYILQSLPATALANWVIMTHTAASELDMLSLSARVGDVVVRTDLPTPSSPFTVSNHYLLL